MKEKKDIFLGVRFSKEEMEQIDSIRKESRLNKSEMVRQWVQEAITAKNNQNSCFEKEMEAVRERLEAIHQTNRYVASLLTALVRKSSRSHPEEAEKMILAARADAVKRQL